MAELLAQNPDIQLVYAHNDPMAYGAYLAASDLDRAKRIAFLGIDGIPAEGVRWVQEGALTATFEYKPPGAEGLRQALKLLEGGTAEKRVTLFHHDHRPVQCIRDTQSAWNRQLKAAPMESPQSPRAADRVEASGRKASSFKLKLFLAFLCIGLLTSFTALVAFIAFGQLGRAVERMEGEAFPRMVAAMRLSERTTLLAASAPVGFRPRKIRLHWCRTPASLNAILQEINSSIDSLDAAPGTSHTGEIRDYGRRMAEVLRRLEEATQVKLNLHAQRSAKLQNPPGGAGFLRNRPQPRRIQRQSI